MFRSLLDGIRIFFSFANIYILLGIVFNTVISLEKLLIIAILFILFGIFIFKWIKKEWFLVFKRFDYYGLLLPTIFNGFFLFNFIFSSQRVQEKYSFTFSEIKSIGNQKIFPSYEGESTTILLENNAYKEFYLIRTFPDYNQMKGRKTITYGFEKGFFGLKVMKHYEFSK